MRAGKYIIICPNFRQIIIQTSGVQNNWGPKQGHSGQGSAKCCIPTQHDHKKNSVIKIIVHNWESYTPFDFKRMTTFMCQCSVTNKGFNLQTLMSKEWPLSWPSWNNLILYCGPLLSWFMMEIHTTKHLQVYQGLKWTVWHHKNLALRRPKTHLEDFCDAAPVTAPQRNPSCPCRQVNLASLTICNKGLSAVAHMECIQSCFPHILHTSSTRQCQKIQWIQMSSGNSPNDLRRYLDALIWQTQKPKNRKNQGATSTRSEVFTLLKVTKTYLFWTNGQGIASVQVPGQHCQDQICTSKTSESSSYVVGQGSHTLMKWRSQLHQ